MQEPGLAEIIPFTHTSPVWDQCPVFTSGASFPRGSPSGVAAVWWLLDSGYSSPSWIPSGLSSSHQGLQSLIWLWHPCLLIQQEIFHFSHLIITIPTNKINVLKSSRSNVLSCCEFQILSTWISFKFKDRLLTFPEHTANSKNVCSHHGFLPNYNMA